jgi:hypothetical protein
MLRTSLALTLAATAAASLAGCLDPFGTPDPIENPDDPDAGPAIDAPPPDANLECEPRVNQVTSGYHNPGTNCLECHNGQQAGAPVFTFGGTAYAQDKVTPVVGATVIVIDAAGTVVKVPTMQNGNFYSSTPLVPPYITGMSRCPDNVTMIQNFRDGDCNSCHGPVGAPGRVTFP